MSTTQENNTSTEVDTYDAPAVRVTPVPPLGTHGATVNAYELLETGATLGSMGLERAAVTALMQKLQATSTRVTLETLPSLLNELRDVQKARLNKVMQQVRAIPMAAPMVQPGILSRLSAPIVMPDLVSRDAVLQLLAVAMSEIPTVA